MDNPNTLCFSEISHITEDNQGFVLGLRNNSEKPEIEKPPTFEKPNLKRRLSVYDALALLAHEKKQLAEQVRHLRHEEEVL
jgi:hypothetical protein